MQIKDVAMKDESGRSMIEMLGVLAIMGVITLGAIVLTRQGMGMQKRNQVVEQVMQMVTNVQQTFSGYDDYSSLNPATIFDVISMSRKNPYGGTYELAINSANPRQFIISITGLSKSDCEYFTTRAWQGSVGYQISDGKESGATSRCNLDNSENVVQIIYGE